MKYIEIGLGNSWLIRTEIELDDGTEYEEKGITGPISFYSAYIRIWIGRSVYILDMKEGYKRIIKNRRACKVIFGIVSH